MCLVRDPGNADTDDYLAQIAILAEVVPDRAVCI